MLSRDAEKWLYRLEENFTWDSKVPVDRDRYFTDASGVVRLIIEKEGRITVTKGYAWNGCSPTFLLGDLLIGTPDGAVYRGTGHRKAYEASLIHDALYQFLRADSPYKRHQADRFFLELLTESRFIWRHVYWLAVRTFGLFVWKATSVSRQWRGKGEIVA